MRYSTLTIMMVLISIVGAGTIAPFSVHAEMQDIRVTVYGMTCEFCEYALEKNIGSSGVRRLP